MLNNDSLEDSVDLKHIQERLASFAAERDWDQFHSPKNLAMALAGEAGELLEIFQWLTEEQSRSICTTAKGKKKVEEEVADIAIYLARLCDKLGLDLNKAVMDKIAVNEQKYPVSKAKGNAKKYNEV